ncbi:MAG: class I SAM-dependent methyltransferase [candidate division WOR-3 bacterium]|jgi:ubiquinone/menaquinone biosynthesis C-methylase UbiE
MKRKKDTTSKRIRFYNELASLYDFICTPENRKRDVAVLERIIKRHVKSKGKELLDVACGTGLEDSYLKKNFNVTGLDLNTAVLRIARKRNPEITYLQGDMRTFRIDKTFDIITCFDAMCYLRNYRDLRQTLANFHRHLKPGGLLIFYIDPVFLKEHFKQETFIVSHKTKDNKTVILFEAYRKQGKKIKGYAAYLILEPNRERFEEDAFETLGFFAVSRIRGILQRLNLRTYMYDTGARTTFSLRRYDGTKHSPVFVCQRRLRT